MSDYITSAESCQAENDSSSLGSVGAVVAVWQHPLKSAQGTDVQGADFNEFGMIGDRSWATKDLQRGGIRGAKQIAPLMSLRVEYLGTPTPENPSAEIRISAPGHQGIDSSDPFVDHKLSAMLGHPVTLEALRPATDTEHYQRGTPDLADPIAALRQTFGRTDDEPLPDLSDFTHIFEYESPPGTYVDAYPVQLITTTSLQSLQDLHPDSSLDVRWFRPNLVLELDDDNSASDARFPEQTWVGSCLRIGEAELEVVTGSPRCVMITRGFDDIPQDRAVLRSVVKEADQVLGIYANVTKPGRIQSGDHVHVIRRSSDV